MNVNNEVYTVVAFVANLLIVVSVVSCAALAMTRWLFRNNPAARHFVCLGGLVGVLLAPAIVLGVSSTHFGLEAYRFGTAPPARISYLYYQFAPASKTYYRAAVHYHTHEQVNSRNSRLAASIGWMLAIWAAGSIFGAIRLAHGLRQASRYRQTAENIATGCVEEALSAFEQDKLNALPPILTSHAAQTPMAAGICRPAIILPARLLETLSAVQLRHILVHELTHIRLRHGISGLIQRLAGVLFWPHPLVHVLCARLSAAREEICDNVASQDSGAACYARTLLAVAELNRCAPSLSSGLAYLRGPGTSLGRSNCRVVRPEENKNGRT